MSEIYTVSWEIKGVTILKLARIRFLHCLFQCEMCSSYCLPQLINSVVLLILLSALNDPVQYRYHLTSSELGTDVDVMDDASE